MKIYGSLFLWVPVTIFLIWLGIKELPDSILYNIKMALIVLYGIFNIIAIVCYLADYELRQDIRYTLLVDKSYSELIIPIIVSPIILIPLITIYLNDKLTIKI